MCQLECYAWRLLFLALFLSGCSVGAERVQIAVHDDLSSTVQLILTQSQQSYDEQTKNQGTPELENAKNEVSNCGFSVKNNASRSDRYGIIATANFASKEELEFALSCIVWLSQLLTVQPLKVNEGLLGTDYELPLEVVDDCLIGAGIGEVRVTLPGNMELITPIAPATFGVASRLEGLDTVVWKFSALSDSCESRVGSSTQLNRILLDARSHSSKIRVEWILSVVAILFGSGVVFQVIRSRRKSTTKSD